MTRIKTRPHSDTNDYQPVYLRLYSSGGGLCLLGRGPEGATVLRDGGKGRRPEGAGSEIADRRSALGDDGAVRARLASDCVGALWSCTGGAAVLLLVPSVREACKALSAASRPGFAAAQAS